jgi:PAS domain S-box-containing protein
LLEAQRLSHTGSWKHDIASGKVTVSPEVYRIFGVGPNEVKSTTEFWLNRNHPEDAKRIQEVFEESEIQKTDYEADYRIVLPDGTIRHLHAVGHPVVNESGDLVEFVGTAIDVTEQAQARIELEKAFEEIKRLKDRLHDENLALREQIDQAFMFEEIVGASPALQSVLSSIVKVAPTDSTVLITGETGTGKELIARAIHKHSQRSGQAFISVNCASIPSSLIASELFGHEKGAFTGAVQRRQGRFEMAHSGTIFLDEVGELPTETQIALLRVLQERQFERVGGNRILPTDVRVIAATNRDLTAAIAAGTFRTDLFYRLNVFPIEVPPLRKRKEDIPMLVEYFVKRYAEKAGKQICKIDNNTLERCQSYPWPGNIRELQNIVERSVILCSGDTFWIERAWLTGAQPPRPELAGPLPDTLQNQERKIIETALTESKGKVAGPEGAAAKLGIPRSTLDTKIKQLGIKKYRFISK